MHVTATLLLSAQTRNREQLRCVKICFNENLPQPEQLQTFHERPKIIFEVAMASPNTFQQVVLLIAAQAFKFPF